MTEQEWRARYAARIVAVAKTPLEDAQQCAENVALDDGIYDIETDSPEEAADDEMEYWDD